MTVTSFVALNTGLLLKLEFCSSGCLCGVAGSSVVLLSSTGITTGLEFLLGVVVLYSTLTRCGIVINCQIALMIKNIPCVFKNL